MKLIKNDFDTFYEEATIANSISKKEIVINGKGSFLAVSDFKPLNKLNFKDPIFTLNGIYIYQCKKDDNRYSYYVGKAGNLKRRTLEHLRHYDNLNAHDSPALHAAMRKYGLDKFNFAILDADIDNLNEAEQSWINILNTYLNREDYNLTAGGDGGYTKEPKITKELFIEIVDRLANTSETPSDIASSYMEKDEETNKIIWSIGATTIKNICYGNVSDYLQEYKAELSTKYTWPLRTEEERAEIGKKATKEKTHELFVGFLPNDLTIPIKVVYGTNEIVKLEDPEYIKNLDKDKLAKGSYGYSKVGKYLNGYDGKPAKKYYQPIGYKYTWAKYSTLDSDVQDKVLPLLGEI